MSDPKETARRSAEAMWAGDRASQDLGMELLEVGPGTATLAMTVSDSMVNGHDTAHGGFIFALADSAFAFACNGYNQVTVAQNCTITYVSPGRIGDRLTAEAREVSRKGRSGIYDIRISNQSGDLVAEFRGLSRTVKGTHLPDPA